MKTGAGTPILAGVQRLLWLWLPGLGVFLMGLHRAWLTGQVDPWDWAMPGCVVLIVLGFLGGMHARFLLLWAGPGWIATALLFCGLASARLPQLWAMAGLALLGALAGGGSILLRGGAKFRILGVLALIIAALLLWRGPIQPIQQIAERPKLAVLTGLPLFWAEDGSGQRREAPIISLLATRFSILPLDSPGQLKGSQARLLLLAQPRALTPKALVEIDRWVRSGGRALVFSDPALRWPSALPLGDRRRAPVSAYALDPLQKGWGIEPVRMEQGEARIFLTDGSLMTINGATLSRSGVFAERRIGEGAVTWVGDADMLDDRLWLADPSRPFDPRVWSADTPKLIARWLGVPMNVERRWMRTGQDVAAALRLALIAGTIWAILGGWLLGTRFCRFPRLQSSKENTASTR